MMTDDEKQWTRLIDGELSFSEQRAMLATLEETPNGWKRLALGLLEAESFRRELRGALQNGPFSPVGEKVAVRPDEGVMGGRILIASSPSHPDPLPRSGREGTVEWAVRKRGMQRELQMAMACVIGLICLGVGMGIERYRQPVNAGVEPATPVATTFAANEIQTQQTLKLVFADGPAGMQSVEVPVINIDGNMAVKLLRQSAVPDEFRQKLEARGYVIHEERKYVPITLTNGRQGIAPVSDVVVERQPVAFQ